MRQEIGGGRALAQSLSDLGITDHDVLEAVARVPRAAFLSAGFQGRARDNDALPIGYGQTTSQPWVIARMLELACAAGPLGRVLEVGTGCGYQTAVLSHLADEVYSVERVGALLTAARDRLHELAYTKPRLAHRDGMKGLPEAAPYDAIIVCAAARGPTAELLAQLAPGGRLVLPEKHADHELLTVHTADGTASHEPVMFVPLLEGVA